MEVMKMEDLCMYRRLREVDEHTDGRTDDGVESRMKGKGMWRMHDCYGFDSEEVLVLL